jgi:hypothetical protein
MNTNELKQEILEDVKHLKHLEIEIIPAKIYYAGLLKLLISAFWKIGLVLFVSVLYVFLTYTDPHASMTEAYWGVARTPTFYWEQIQEALFMAIGITLIALLVLTKALSNYFLIQYYLKDQLKTGGLLVKKLRDLGWWFLSAFILFSIMFASYAEPNVIFFFEGIALILSAVVTYFVMGMEFNRVGLSILFTVIRRWFNGDKT